MNVNTGSNFAEKTFLQHQQVGWTAIGVVHNSDSGVEWMWYLCVFCVHWELVHVGKLVICANTDITF